MRRDPAGAVRSQGGGRPGTGARPGGGAWWDQGRQHSLTRCRKLRRSRSGGVAAMVPVTFRPRPYSARAPANHRLSLTPRTNYSRAEGLEADFGETICA